MSSGRHTGAGSTGDREERAQRLPRMDPEIAAVAREAGRGINPMGFKQLPQPTGPYNPYAWFVFGALLVGVGGYLGWQLRGSVLLAIVLAALFVACGAWILAFTARRTPAWVRARRAVREFVSRTGKEFPRDLRWFG